MILTPDGGISKGNSNSKGNTASNDTKDDTEETFGMEQVAVHHQLMVCFHK